jgi:hypothetical protein
MKVLAAAALDLRERALGSNFGHDHHGGADDMCA